MYNRRSFIQSLICFPCLAWLKVKPKQQSYVSEFGLGKYIKHGVVFANVYYAPPSEPGIRYVNFPLEHKLTIYFERGYQRYVGFNLTKDDVAAINQMSIEELLTHRFTDKDEENRNGKWAGDIFQFDSGKLLISEIAVY